jgi:hypothetical protein
MFRGLRLPVASGVAATLVLLATAPLWSAQNSTSSNPGEVLSPPTATKNMAAVTTTADKVQPGKTKLERTKNDAAELSALADQLRDELKKLNANVFSLDVFQKTEKVENLVKKIKEDAHGQ